MALQPTVTLLEFNELSPALMERFIADGKLPNFKRLRDQSEVFISEAEERAPYLEPWIQWVTVHCGVPYSEHGVFNLSEGHKLRHKCVWDLVSEAGRKVWVCGSMNVRYEEGVRGYILPDAWSTDVEPYPEALLPYFRFIQRNVQEHTNERAPLAKSDYLKFLRFMAGHGLSPRTVNSIVEQLISEKKTRNVRWRRAFLMDKLQFDVFGAVYRHLKPSFSSFFLNSTAHMQHMYWRNMEPELFRVAPSSDEQRQYASAILFGYQEMDKLLGRMLAVVGDQATVIFATALSQQACLKYEETGGKHSYRPRDFAALLSYAGVTSPYQVAPVMAEQFWIHLQSVSDAVDAEAKLGALRLGEQAVMEIRRDGASVFASCCINRELDHDVVLRIADSDRSVPFFQVFYPIEGVKSGMHHPDGILWIRHPQRLHAIHQEKVGLTSVAPTILDILGIEKPEYMKGQSLMADAGAAANPATESRFATR